MKCITNIHTKVKFYWPLFKSLQTGLLLLTGLAGFMGTRCPVSNWQTVLALTSSLFLAISGSTILNMWYDRDIDAVCLATPVTQHARQSIAALGAGKHVLSEVTASYTLEEGWDLISAVERSGRKP